MSLYLGEKKVGTNNTVVKEVPKEKFGATVDTFLGDVDANGALKSPTWPTHLVFSGVKTVDDYGLYYTFFNCTSITSVDMPSLQTVDNYGLQYAFYNCTGITSVDMSSLQTVGNSSLSYAFSGCNKLTTISFPSLTSVQTNSFASSASDGAFRNCTGLTEIHFRADMQATIEAMTGYANKWGATSSTIYFDL